MIPQSFIQDLLGRVDIVEVVDRHVKLKRAGANHVACCPFHSEKSPSFTVSPTKQFYHCFGCGAHGTAVGFLMEYSGMGFVEAVKELAQSVGMKVPEEPRSESAQRRAQQGESLHEVLLRAAQHYRNQLKDAPQAIAYLKQRGLSGDIAKRFGIGYVPEEWQNLAAAFSDYDGPMLATAGLVKQKDDGKRYDVFRNRIIFPIVDVRGNVIGFGGRVLEGGGADPAAQGQPKYLNSPETPVFEKGRELYGLYQARRAIRDAGRVVVVEGYMDVVALAQAGVEYAVATLGTATTPQHVQKLLRQADEIVFCFDGDDAGRRAAWRALENSLALLTDGKQLKFLFLPEGEDPDTYVRKHGKGAFESLLDKGAVPLSRFLLDELTGRVDLATAEGRAKCVHEAKPLLKQMPANALRMQLVRELAEKCRLSPEEVAQLCELGAPAAARPQAAPAQVARKPVTPLARQMLRALVSNPACAGNLPAGQRVLLSSPELAPVAALVDAVMETGADTPGKLFEATRDTQYANLYQEVAADVMAPTDDASAKADLDGAFNQLELQCVKSEFKQLSDGGQRTEVERQRFQEVKQRMAELQKVTTGSRAQI
ncbi:MAG: DNA primase [Betaproteobacteria bacterium RIFCSPLOWO2_02_FULL_67_26]|nr:MAG: DNA primase [Betaproteobacteria bacterium RIFCSPLOWO2_02_FULL_67_26]